MGGVVRTSPRGVSDWTRRLASPRVETNLSPRRLWNAARKVAAGLPLGGEAVWPGLANDLFAAHESIYRYAARWAPARRVLDAACGTGYGSFLLASSGATSVLGIDREPRRVRFASRRYFHATLSFRVGDCERLDLPSGTLELVVSSNTLEHLAEPGRFLRCVAGALGAAGQLLVAVPPVLSDADLREHARNRDHLSNLSVRGWGELFRREGWRFEYLSHRCAKPLDFHSFRRTRVTWEDFAFVEEALDEAYAAPPITAIFRLRRT